jgi:hypothetical protein
VEKIVTVRVELPSVPGPFSEDVSMDDFVPRTRRGPVLFLTFREPASGEVSVFFNFPYPVVYFCCYILASDKDICVMIGFRFPAFG